MDICSCFEQFLDNCEMAIFSSPSQNLILLCMDVCSCFEQFPDHLNIPDVPALTKNHTACLPLLWWRTLIFAELCILWDFHTSQPMTKTNEIEDVLGVSEIDSSWFAVSVRIPRNRIIHSSCVKLQVVMIFCFVEQFPIAHFCFSNSFCFEKKSKSLRNLLQVWNIRIIIILLSNFSHCILDAW